MTEEKQAITTLANEIVKVIKTISANTPSRNYDGSATVKSINASKVIGLPAAFNSIIGDLESAAVSGDAIAQQTIIALQNVASGNFETLTVDTAMMERLYATYGDFINLVAEEATIGDLDVGAIRASMSEIGLANIGTAIIDTAQIRRASTGTLFVRDEVGGNVYIDDLAVTDANIVTLAAGKILLNDSQGNLVELYVDAQGNPATRGTSYNGNDIINSNTLNGNRIVQNSITADRLNASEIFAKNATIMDLIGDNIDATRITTGHLNANYIRGGELVLGGDNNANGTIKVLDWQNNTVGTITKDGFVTSQIYSNDTYAAKLTGGEMIFTNNSGQMGRLLLGKVGGTDSTVFFIQGPSSSGTNHLSSLEFWPVGDTHLLSGDEAATLNLYKNGDASINNSGDANINSGGSIGFNSDGDITLSSRTKAIIRMFKLETLENVRLDGDNVILQSTKGANIYVTDQGDVEIRSKNATASLIIKANGTITASTSGGTINGAINVLGNVISGSSSFTAQSHVSAQSDEGQYFLYSNGSGNSNAGIKGLWTINSLGIGTSVIQTTDTNASTFYGNVTGNAANVTGTVAIDHGGTGATTPALARVSLEITPANIGAVAKSGDTMTGTLTSTSSVGLQITPSSARAYLKLIPTDDYAADIQFGCSNSVKWSISSGRSAEDYFLGLYNYITPGWPIKVSKANVVTLSNPLPVGSGGTNATTAQNARANLGLGSVTNNFRVNNHGGGTTQTLVLRYTVDNSNNTILNGKELGLFINNTGISLHNFTSGSPAWSLGVPIGVTQGGTGATTTTAYPGLRNLGLKIKTYKSYSANDNGNISLGLQGARYQVLCVYSNSDGYIFMPYIASNGQWSAHITDNKGNTAYPEAAGDAVCLWCIYLDYGSIPVATS